MPDKPGALLFFRLATWNSTLVILGSLSRIKGSTAVGGGLTGSLGGMACQYKVLYVPADSSMSSHTGGGGLPVDW
jgi:hypothetical protein